MVSCFTKTNSINNHLIVKLLDGRGPPNVWFRGTRGSQILGEASCLAYAHVHFRVDFFPPLELYFVLCGHGRQNAGVNF